MKRRRVFKHRIADGVALSRNRLQEPPPDDPHATTVGLHMIAVEGHWDGHYMGSFSLDAQIFQQIADHFSGQKVDTVVDYEHASFWGALFGMKAEASGWIKSLEMREGADGAAQLWARVDWTRTAARHIREMEYRYLSPVIVWNTVDRVTGEMGGASLHSLALTNTPFLEELPDVRLNSLPTFLVGGEPALQEDEMDEKQIKALAALVGLTGDASVDDIFAAVKTLTSRWQIGAAVLEALGVDIDASKDKAVGAVLALQDPTRDASEVQALRAELAEMRSARALDQARTAVAAAYSAGKISGPDSAEYKWALKYAQQDPAGFDEAMAARSKQVPTNPKDPPQRRPEEDRALTDEHQDTLRQVGMSPEEFKKFDRPLVRD